MLRGEASTADLVHVVGVSVLIAAVAFYLLKSRNWPHRPTFNIQVRRSWYYCTVQDKPQRLSLQRRIVMVCYIFICIDRLFKTCNLLGKKKPICCLDVGSAETVCKCQYYLFEFGIVLPSVVDQHLFDADPTFHLDAIAYPGPGPDPNPSFYMLENLNFILFLFTAVPVYNVLSVLRHRCPNF